MDTNTPYWIAGAVVLYLLYRGGYLDTLLALLQRPPAGAEKAPAPAAPAPQAQATPQTVVVRVEDGRVSAGPPVEQPLPAPLPTPPVELSGEHSVSYPATVTMTVSREKGAG